MEEKLWHKSYARGVPTTIEYEKVTVPQALRRTAERFPSSSLFPRLVSELEQGATDRYW